MDRLCLPFILSLILALSSCAPTRFDGEMASGYYASSPRQCVVFAREASGLPFRGDAWTWWEQAAVPPHARGNQPVVGAVLVLANAGRMTHGHVAVVTRLVAPDQIDVTQSNWGSSSRDRCRIYQRQRVADISPLHDWTQVEFWNEKAGVFGFPYAAQGFVYR